LWKQRWGKAQKKRTDDLCRGGFQTRPYNPQRQAMPNDLHYFMFFVGRLFQGAEMMIRHSEYIEADESNLMYDFVAAREATRDALKDVRAYLEKISGQDNLGDT
jgi:hypothetical protein